jgi:hypothetical protein
MGCRFGQIRWDKLSGSLDYIDTVCYGQWKQNAKFKFSSRSSLSLGPCHRGKDTKKDLLTASQEVLMILGTMPSYPALSFGLYTLLPMTRTVPKGSD